MPTIQVEIDQLLNAALQLPHAELDQFVKKLLSLRRQSEIPKLPARESELLLKINQGVPAQLQQRFDQLVEKRRDNALNPDEYQELLALTEQVEQFDVERLQWLIELAQLRGLTLDELMQQLGIKPRPYA